jgi:small subunit ribosomal protein S19
MSRSKWKGPYVNLKHTTLLNKNKKTQQIITITRNSEIIPRFLGSNFKVHNGKNYNEVLVTEAMIGHKFGEFSFTIAKFAFKKKKKIKKIEYGTKK